MKTQRSTAPLSRAIRWIPASMALVLSAMLAGCGLTPDAPRDTALHPDQMPDRPGLLTGERGEFLIRSSRDPDNPHHRTGTNESRH